MASSLQVTQKPLEGYTLGKPVPKETTNSLRVRPLQKVNNSPLTEDLPSKCLLAKWLVQCFKQPNPAGLVRRDKTAARTLVIMPTLGRAKLPASREIYIIPDFPILPGEQKLNKGTGVRERQKDWSQICPWHTYIYELL